MYTHAYLRPSMMTRKQCTIAWPPALTTIAEGWIKRSRRCAMRWRPRKAAGINCRYSSVSFRPRHVPHIHCAFLSLPLFPLSPVLLISFKNPYFAPLLPPRRLLHWPTIFPCISSFGNLCSFAEWTCTAGDASICSIRGTRATAQVPAWCIYEEATRARNHRQDPKRAPKGHQRRTSARTEAVGYLERSRAPIGMQAALPYPAPLPGSSSRWWQACVVGPIAWARSGEGRDFKREKMTPIVLSWDDVIAAHIFINDVFFFPLRVI